MLRQMIGGLFFLFSLFCFAENVGATEKSPNSLDAKGKLLFSHYCAHCHGSKGEGNGYNSEFLDKEPANLSDHEFISKKNNDQLFRVISLGGIGVKKSSLMPVFGNTLSQEEIWSLVAYIRSLSGDDSHPVTLPADVTRSRPVVHSLTRQDFEKFLRSFANDEQRKELVSQGEQLFKKKKSCFACHRIGNQGGKVGPDFSRAGLLYKPEWLLTWIPNPQGIKQNTRMPSITLDNDELMAITAYMEELKGGGQAPLEWNSYFEKRGVAKRGEALFFDPNGKANCSKCHQVNGKGGQVGPDLSVLGSSRTASFILESILEPKAVITVGYTSVSVMTKEDKLLTGVKKNEDDSFIDIVDKDGKLLRIAKDQIKKMKTQSISMMPSNFKEILTVEEIRDILAYLETLISPVVNELVSGETRLSMR